VYPGAVHTRLHNSLGAYHLMCNALHELRNKGVDITPEEEVAAKVAILLHDVGHGPFSHALENVLIKGVRHEDISLRIIRILNQEMNGQLDLAIAIFTNQYHKPFLYQLISGQLDVDRMDYLSRDSFFTGVSEGVIGYDRILKMLTVHEGELMVEEKGIFSIEKFLVARRLMYWQVYLHKAVLSAEKMLVKVLERARELILRGESVPGASPALDLFLQCRHEETPIDEHLQQFCLLDDFDVMASIKNWMFHPDTVLATLCEGLIDRRLLKVKLQADPIDPAWIDEQRNRICQQKGIKAEDCHYLLFTGEAVNTTYNPVEEKINILFKDGTVKDISQVDNALISQTLSRPVKKYYICYLK
ncbi:MAG: HD domain-containing protein, partial [Chitinophagaceae bacterium]|nr:HD domain-containing protein [Chitinophagaceae bacterium]